MIEWKCAEFAEICEFGIAPPFFVARQPTAQSPRITAYHLIMAGTGSRKFSGKGLARQRAADDQSNSERVVRIEELCGPLSMSFGCDRVVQGSRNCEGLEASCPTRGRRLRLWGGRGGAMRIDQDAAPGGI